MLKFSRKVDYGLILLAHLRNTRRAASAREMAERFSLPQPMVANILKALTGGGILASTRGAQGGYVLAREARAISLAEVVEALEGPFSLLECTGGEPSCTLMPLCPTYAPIQKVHQKFEAFMAGLTIEEIVGNELVAVTPQQQAHAGIGQR